MLLTIPLLIVAFLNFAGYLVYVFTLLAYVSSFLSITLMPLNYYIKNHLLLHSVLLIWKIMFGFTYELRLLIFFAAL